MEDVSFTDVKIKIPERTWGCEWCHAPEACAEDFVGFEKVSWVEFLARKKTVNFHLLAKALWRVHTWWGADGKARIEKMCISLPYVETFNSKVIKGFVPELRSRYVFFVFRDSYVLCINLWTFYVHFIQSHIITMVHIYKVHNHFKHVKTSYLVII